MFNDVLSLPREHGYSYEELGKYFSVTETTAIFEAWDLLNKYIIGYWYKSNGEPNLYSGEDYPKMYEAAQEPLKKFEDLKVLIESNNG